MKRRIWLFIGAGFGFLIPFLLNVLQHFGTWHVHPSAYLLFRPGLILLLPFERALHRFSDTGLVLYLIISAANSLAFGLLAYGLRKGFLVLLAVLLVIVGLSLPPSDPKLERQFAESKPEFERLIQKASEIPSLVRISNVEVEYSDGRKYGEGDGQFPISAESWTEYRKIFKKTGMKEGLYRGPQTGQVLFLGHTIIGKLGPIGTLYGYVYCPAASKALGGGFLACRVKKDEYNIGDYRHKRISSEWFIVEFFVTHSTVN